MNIHCPQCGRFIEIESDTDSRISFCPFCGNRLNSETSAEENQAEKSESPEESANAEAAEANEETAASLEKTSEETAAPQEETSEETAAPSEETGEETAASSEETGEETAASSEETSEKTAAPQETATRKEEPAVAVQAPDISSLNSQATRPHSSVSQVFSSGFSWLKSRKERLAAFRKEHAQRNTPIENPPAQEPAVKGSIPENQYVIPTPPLPGTEPAQANQNPEQPIPSPPLPPGSGPGYRFDSKQIIPSPPLPGQKPSSNFRKKFTACLSKFKKICGKVFHSLRKIQLRKRLAWIGAAFVGLYGRLRKFKLPRIPFPKINYSQLVLLLCGIACVLLGIAYLIAWKSPQIQVACTLLTLSLIWFFLHNPTSQRFARITGIVCFVSTLIAGSTLGWCKAISPEIGSSWVWWSFFKTAALLLAGIALFAATFDRPFWQLSPRKSAAKAKKPKKPSGPPIGTSKLTRPARAWADDKPVVTPPALTLPAPEKKENVKRNWEQPITRMLIFLVLLELAWLGWGIYKTWKTQDVCDHFAEKGIAPAQYLSASLYLDALNPRQDTERGMELLTAAARQKFAPANELLAQTMFDGGSRSSEVFENWKIAAEKGRRDSMKSLALCYANGWGTEPNENEMIFWLLKASNLGQAEAQYHLAMAYWDGKGTAQNDEQALYWLNTSASHNYPDALYFLGKITFAGERVTPFQAQGVEYLLLASELGNEDASKFLKNFFCEKNGMDICPEPGLHWLIKCSESEENDWAVKRLNRYFREEKGLEKFPKEGFEWIEKQAKNENPEAALMLSHCYMEGDLTDKNEDQGFLWLTKSAEAGLLPAQKELADDYYQGIHTQKNLENAYQWYERAMNQKDLDAKYSVANCKYCGRGTAQDQPVGIQLWEEAANEGHEPSREKLNEIFIDEDGLVNLQEQGIAWLQQEEKNGNSEAKRKLENFYQENQSTPEAIAFFEKKAKEEDPEAQLKIGRIYLLGLGTAQNVSQGFSWLKKADLNGRSEAGKLLDNFSFQQENNQKFPQETIAWLEKRAEEGNIQAQLRVGEILLGNDSKPSVSKGFQWLRRAELNSQAKPEDQVKAVQLLDSFSFRPESIRKYPEETIAWLEKRAEEGNARAQIQVGKVYLEGSGVSKDPRKAVSYLKKAAEENSEAISLLDEYFVQSAALPEPAQEGISWLERRSNDGNETAQLKLANCYLQGISVQNNPSKAIVHLEKAAKQKNPEALLLLGECYQKGLGISKNLSKAFECFKESATGGNVTAQCNAARFCKEGIGTEQNSKEAAAYWKAASEQGNSEALYEYGKCCEDGVGTAKDVNTAALCFSKAADQGHCEAQLEFGKCCLSGLGTPVNLFQGVKNISAAAAKGNDEALAIWGECCVQGKGTDQNRSLGLQKLVTAEKNGWKPAGESLRKFLLNGKNTDSDVQNSEVREWIQKQADDGDPSAQLLIGKSMYEGKGWKKDTKKAVALLQKASKAGNKEAEDVLVKWSLQDKNIKPSAPVLRQIQELAGKEHPGALVYLGKCNLYGWEMEENQAQAFAFFQKAANLGDPDGQYFLGYCYELGYGTKKSPSESNAWYKKAARQGHLKAKEKLVEPNN